MSKRQNPAGTDDSEGLKSKQMKTSLYTKLKKISNEADLLFFLFESATQKLLNPNVQHEVDVLKETIQENKTVLDQIKEILDSHAKEFQNMSKRQTPAWTDDSECQNSNQMKTSVYTKLENISNEANVLFSLFERASRKVLNHNVQHEVALLEKTIQEFKTDFDQIKEIPDSRAEPSISNHPPAVNDVDPVSPTEEIFMNQGNISPQHARQIGEQDNLISIVGRDITTANNATINIPNIGNRAVDDDRSTLMEALKCLRLALERPTNETPSSSVGADETAAESAGESLRTSTSVVHSPTVFQFLSQRVGSEWKFLGRNLGLHDATLDHINIDNEHIQECIYKMLLQWKREKGPEATYSNLISALEEANRKDLAHKLWLNAPEEAV